MAEITRAQALSAIAALPLVVAGCGRSAGDAHTLRWVVDPNPIRAEQIALFEKTHPGVRIVNDPDAGPQRILTQLAGGVPPDVFAIYSAQSCQMFARKDVLEDLRPWVERDHVDMGAFWPELDSTICAGGNPASGRIYGFPDNCGVYVLFYNQRMFREAGVAPPDASWTWDDLIHAAQRLTKRENGRITQFGIVLPTPDMVEMMLWQMGGTWYSPDGTECTTNSPAGHAAFETWASLRRTYHVAPSPSEEQGLAGLGGWGGSLNLFKAEKAAMVISGRWLIIEFRRNPHLLFEIAPVPHEQHHMTLLATKVYAIPSACRHKALAFEFLKHLISRDDAMLIAGYGDGIPSIRKYCETPQFLFDPRYPNERDNKLYLTEMPHSRTRQISAWVQQLDADTILGEETDRIWQGEITPSQAADNIARRVNAIIRRNRANPNLMD